MHNLKYLNLNVISFGEDHLDRGTFNQEVLGCLPYHTLERLTIFKREKIVKQSTVVNSGVTKHSKETIIATPERNAFLEYDLNSTDSKNY